MVELAESFGNDVICLFIKTTHSVDIGEGKKWEAGDPPYAGIYPTGGVVMTADQKIVIVQGAGKSTMVAVILAFLFGPLGMMYSTVSGGVIMLIISLIVGIFTLGFGLLFTWPVCVIWAALAADRQNKKVLASS